MDEFAFQNRPILWLHPDEPHYPISIQEYLSSSNILPTANGTDNIIYEGPITSQYLNDNSSSLPPTSTLLPSSEFQESVKEGNISDVDSVPFYYHVINHDGYYYITYIYVFGYNWNYPVIFNLFPIGAHWADFEHTTHVFDEKTMELSRIYYGAHSETEGQWVKKRNIQFTGIRPSVYCAKGSHAMYSTAGYYLRFGGFANDITNPNRTKWDPTVATRLYSPDDTVNFVPETMGFLKYTGTWGNGKISGIQNKTWWATPWGDEESHKPLRSSINIETEWWILVAVILSIIAIASWLVYKKIDSDTKLKHSSQDSINIQPDNNINTRILEQESIFEDNNIPHKFNWDTTQL